MSNTEHKKTFWQRFLKSMTKANEMEREDEVLLDHDYDGIKELDNVLPPWWLYGFFITIGISIFYYFAIHILGWYGQEDEYRKEVAAFQEYKEANPELFSTANLIAKMDEASLAKGKELFNTKTCTACHTADAGGLIGPNLTDKYWILGGDFQSIFNTISKGGRPGKGMVAWEKTISTEDRQLLASYILSLQGTTPANPKAPEGDIWENGKKAGGDTKEEVTIDYDGMSLKAYKGGIEEQLIDFIKSGDYAKASVATLAEKWFNFDNINFEMGSSDQLTEGSMVQLENLAKIIKANPGIKIKLGGYTDKKGDDAFNKELSQKRADYLKSELTRLGIGSQITGAEGYGEEFATVDENASDDERAVDRKMALRLDK